MVCVVCAKMHTSGETSRHRVCLEAAADLGLQHALLHRRNIPDSAADTLA
jgi:hypothetical protein